NHHLFRMLPHQKLVWAPFIMKSQLRNSKDVLFFWIDIDVVIRTGKCWCLDESTNRGGIVTFDFLFVFRTEAFKLQEVAGNLATTVTYIKRISSNKFLFHMIFQVLPASHPGNG